MQLTNFIDFAILKPTDTEKDLIAQCELAKKAQVASVCVKPCHVKKARELLFGSVVEVGTVVGFPHGGSTIENKISETREAIENGASEIDFVINIAKAIENDFEYIEKEIRELVDTIHSKGAIAKVIFETCYLNEEQKITLCQICSDVETDYVKTSTGFGTSGATIEDILLFRQHLTNAVKIKASGGIKTIDQAKAFIEAGCQRLGLSSKDFL